MSRPRVLLADDHPALLEAEKGLLSPYFDVIETVADGAALVLEAMGKIVALVGDAHTYLQAPQDNARIPVDFARFGNTYRVDAASQELSRLLGARVIKVGDTPVEHPGELLFRCSLRMKILCWQKGSSRRAGL